MIKIALYTPRYKRPTYYYYNKKEFVYCVEQQLINLKWVFGISLSIDE